MLEGGCHCGAIRFQTPEQPVHAAVCHCHDCQRQSGAPMLAWAMFPAVAVAVRGAAKAYPSSASGRRSFCDKCGTGLFFTNAMLDEMGMVQVRIAAMDDPGAIVPKMQVQTADRIDWMAIADALPAFERFPV